MADEEQIKDTETRRLRIFNDGPGPRQVLIPNDGKTIPKGDSVVLEMSYADLKGIKPYIDLGHLRVEDAEDEELESVTSGDIGGGVPLKTGNVVDAASVGGNGDIVPLEPEVRGEDGEQVENDSPVDGDSDQTETEGVPAQVEHRGFGRWYGLDANGEKITAAMTEDEAVAYAEEHKLGKINQPDPSADDDTPPGDDTPPLDETETEQQS